MKNPLWKQQSPTDQLITIRMALEGTSDNFANGVTTKEVYVVQMNFLFGQLEMLQPFLEGKEQW